MVFFSFLKKNSEAFQNKLLLFFALAGLSNFFIIAMIILSLGDMGSGFPQYKLLAICISVVVFIVTQNYSLNQTAILVEQIITRIRLRFIQKIREAELISFEKIGTTRYHTLLTQETATISNASKLIARSCSALSIIVIAGVYIGYLSLAALLLSIGMILAGVQIYQQSIANYQRKAFAAYQQETHFFGLMKHYLYGFKELKVDTKKSSDLFLNFLTPSGKLAETMKTETGHRLNDSVLFAQVYFYILLGIMIFIFPTLITLDSTTLIQIAALLLFVTSGPLGELVEAIPLLEKANLAIGTLERMETELAEVTHSVHFPSASREPIPDFQSLDLSGVVFDYPAFNGYSGFHIGPLHLSIRRGEIVFLMGGNGAGKTTLLKVLTGLYPPKEGKILWNGQPVGPANCALYHSIFSPLFQDMHLFDRLYGIQRIDRKKTAELLREMQLEHKTAIQDDGKLFHVALSAGQKKRMALVVMELENHEVCIFDEWAADQDPVFRKYFYEEYLKKLVHQGKTVIAVTHDDHYYNVADRIYRMDYGILTEIST